MKRFVGGIVDKVVDTGKEFSSTVVDKLSGAPTSKPNTQTSGEILPNNPTDPQQVFFAALRNYAANTNNKDNLQKLKKSIEKLEENEQQNPDAYIIFAHILSARTSIEVLAEAYGLKRQIKITNTEKFLDSIPKEIIEDKTLRESLFKLLKDKYSYTDKLIASNLSFNNPFARAAAFEKLIALDDNYISVVDAIVKENSMLSLADIFKHDFAQLFPDIVNLKYNPLFLSAAFSKMQSNLDKEGKTKFDHLINELAKFYIDNQRKVRTNGGNLCEATATGVLAQIISIYIRLDKQKNNTDYNQMLNAIFGQIKSYIDQISLPATEIEKKGQENPPVSKWMKSDLAKPEFFESFLAIYAGIPDNIKIPEQRKAEAENIATVNNDEKDKKPISAENKIENKSAIPVGKGAKSELCDLKNYYFENIILSIIDKVNNSTDAGQRPVYPLDGPQAQQLLLSLCNYQITKNGTLDFTSFDKVISFIKIIDVKHAHSQLVNIVNATFAGNVDLLAIVCQNKAFDIAALLISKGAAFEASHQKYLYDLLQVELPPNHEVSLEFFPAIAKQMKIIIAEILAAIEAGSSEDKKLEFYLENFFGEDSDVFESLHNSPIISEIIKKFVDQILINPADEGLKAHYKAFINFPTVKEIILNEQKELNFNSFVKDVFYYIGNILPTELDRMVGEIEVKEAPAVNSLEALYASTFTVQSNEPKRTKPTKEEMLNSLGPVRIDLARIWTAILPQEDRTQLYYYVFKPQDQHPNDNVLGFFNFLLHDLEVQPDYELLKILIEKGYFDFAKQVLLSEKLEEFKEYSEPISENYLRKLYRENLTEETRNKNDLTPIVDNWDKIGITSDQLFNLVFARRVFFPEFFAKLLDSDFKDQLLSKTLELVTMEGASETQKQNLQEKKLEFFNLYFTKYPDEFEAKFDEYYQGNPKNLVGLDLLLSTKLFGEIAKNECKLSRELSGEVAADDKEPKDQVAPVESLTEGAVTAKPTTEKEKTAVQEIDNSEFMKKALFIILQISEEESTKSLKAINRKSLESLIRRGSFVRSEDQKGAEEQAFILNYIQTLLNNPSEDNIKILQWLVKEYSQILESADLEYILRPLFRAENIELVKFAAQDSECSKTLQDIVSSAKSSQNPQEQLKPEFRLKLLREVPAIFGGVDDKTTRDIQVRMLEESLNSLILAENIQEASKILAHVDSLAAINPETILDYFISDKFIAITDKTQHFKLLSEMLDKNIDIGFEREYYSKLRATLNICKTKAVKGSVEEKKEYLNVQKALKVRIKGGYDKDKNALPPHYNKSYTSSAKAGLVLGGIGEAVTVAGILFASYSYYFGLFTSLLIPGIVLGASLLVFVVATTVLVRSLAKYELVPNASFAGERDKNPILSSEMGAVPTFEAVKSYDIEKLVGLKAPEVEKPKDLATSKEPKDAVVSEGKDNAGLDNSKKGDTNESVVTPTPATNNPITAIVGSTTNDLGVSQ